MTIMQLLVWLVLKQSHQKALPLSLSLALGSAFPQVGLILTQVVARWLPAALDLYSIVLATPVEKHSSSPKVPTEVTELSLWFRDHIPIPKLIIVTRMMQPPIWPCQDPFSCSNRSVPPQPHGPRVACFSRESQSATQGKKRTYASKPGKNNQNPTLL